MCNSQETWPRRFLSRVWEGRGRPGWLASISAVYVGDVGTELLEDIRKPWGLLAQNLGSSVGQSMQQAWSSMGRLRKAETITMGTIAAQDT